MNQSVFFDRRPDLRVRAEQVAVVGETDPARRVEQVVVGEREVRASSRADSRRRSAKPTSQGLRKSEHGEPPRASAARRLARRRSTAGEPVPGRSQAPRLPAHGHGTPAAARLLQLRVDLLVDLGEPALQVLRPCPACHLARKFWNVVEVVRPDRGDRNRRRVRVDEDLPEDREVRVRLQLLRLRRAHASRGRSGSRSRTSRARGRSSSGT